MVTVNWTTMFSGFDGVGTVLGDFVTNLVTGLAPAMILLVVIAGVLAIIGAMIYGVVTLLKGAMGKVHKRG
jgi:hypothetical protein